MGFYLPGVTVAHPELTTSGLFKDAICTQNSVRLFPSKKAGTQKFGAIKCKSSLVQVGLIWFLPFLRQDELVQKQTLLLLQVGGQMC